MKDCHSKRCPIYQSGNFPNKTCETCKAYKEVDEVEMLKERFGMKEKK
jgi:hypothetical protein